MKRPAFSFSVRQSMHGFSERPLRMIRAGSMPSSACMSLSERTLTWWSIWSTSPRM